MFSEVGFIGFLYLLLLLTENQIPVRLELSARDGEWSSFVTFAIHVFLCLFVFLARLRFNRAFLFLAIFFSNKVLCIGCVSACE